MEVLNFRSCMHLVPLLMKCLYNENNNEGKQKKNETQKQMVIGGVWWLEVDMFWENIFSIELNCYMLL